MKKKKGTETLINIYNKLKVFSGKSLEIYIENNVISKKNFDFFSGHCPFLLCNSDDFCELKKQFEFKILLDVGHLKVSSSTFNLNFEDELNLLIEKTDYLHLSNNNCKEDLGDELDYEFIKKIFLNNESSKFHRTLEIKTLNKIKKSIKLLKKYEQN